MCLTLFNRYFPDGIQRFHRHTILRYHGLYNCLLMLSIAAKRTQVHFIYRGQFLHFPTLGSAPKHEALGQKRVEKIGVEGILRPQDLRKVCSCKFRPNYQWKSTCCCILRDSFLERVFIYRNVILASVWRSRSCRALGLPVAASLSSAL